MLKVHNLTVKKGATELVKQISFTVASGEKVGIIGASGSGKTLTNMALTGLLPKHLETTGSVVFDDAELLGLPDKELANIRGNNVGVVFQDPKTSLHPMRRIGQTVTTALNKHYQVSKKERQAAALQLLELVGLGSDAKRIAHAYPHELSGGQRQRTAIAAAISASPKLLIADEPTTALDATVAAGVLDLFNKLIFKHKMSLIFISHDLAVVSKVCDRVIVMHDGEIVEDGNLRDVIYNPQHKITRELVSACTVTDFSAGGENA